MGKKVVIWAGAILASVAVAVASDAAVGAILDAALRATSKK